MKNKIQLKGIKSYPPKLSKTCLFMLPEGVWLMSNVLNHCMKSILTPDGEITSLTWYEPAYLEQVSPLMEREEQWARIKKEGVNHLLYHLFDSREQADIHLNSLESHNGCRLKAILSQGVDGKSESVSIAEPWQL